MGLKTNPAPIIIVGGGPVGMALAMNLDALGMRSVIINSEPHPRWHPKGSTHNSRTMEHYRRLGLAPRLRSVGLPAQLLTDVVYYTRLNGHELSRIRMPSEAQKMQARRSAAATDQVPEPIFRCNQMHVEAQLFAHLCTLQNVDVRFGWTCLDFREDADGVSVDIEQTSAEETASRRRETLRGSYLAGCDGGQSSVRRKLGIRYDGAPPEEQAYLGGAMVSTHIRCADLLGRIIREPHWQYWVVNAQIRANIVAVSGTDEFLFNTRLQSVSDTPDDAAIKRAFVAAVGEPVEVDIIGHWIWTAGMALVTDRFVSSRVALAGDAVHLFTPAGGFGMNTGVDDAANLGWKLAAMAQGWGGPKLMQSYEIERRPIALRNTNAAKALGRSIGAVPVDAAIEEDSAAGEEARRKAADYLSGFAPEFASLGVQLGARYDGSPIIAGDGSAPPPDDPVNYQPSSVPGGRAPHGWLDDPAAPDKRVSLFDRFGQGFTLLRLSGAGSASGAVSAFAAAAKKSGLPLTIVDIDSPPLRELYACDLALIRPDQHVAWRGMAEGTPDCEAVLARVSGW